jgi:hypothetical protein
VHYASAGVIAHSGWTSFTTFNTNQQQFPSRRRMSATGAYKQAVAGAAEKILSEHRLENLSALHRLQPE